MGGGVSSLPAEVTLAEAKELAGAEWQPEWEEKFAEAKISRDEVVKCWKEAEANNSDPSADGPESKGAGPPDERKRKKSATAKALWKKGVAKVCWIAHAKARAAAIAAARTQFPVTMLVPLLSVARGAVGRTGLRYRRRSRCPCRR